MFRRRSQAKNDTGAGGLKGLKSPPLFRKSRRSSKSPSGAGTTAATPVSGKKPPKAKKSAKLTLSNKKREQQSPPPLESPITTLSPLSPSRQDLAIFDLDDDTITRSNRKRTPLTRSLKFTSPDITIANRLHMDFLSTYLPFTPRSEPNGTKSTTPGAAQNAPTEDADEDATSPSSFTSPNQHSQGSHSQLPPLHPKQQQKQQKLKTKIEEPSPLSHQYALLRRTRKKNPPEQPVQRTPHVHFIAPVPEDIDSLYTIKLTPKAPSSSSVFSLPPSLPLPPQQHLGTAPLQLDTAAHDNSDVSKSKQSKDEKYYNFFGFKFRRQPS